MSVSNEQQSDLRRYLALAQNRAYRRISEEMTVNADLRPTDHARQQAERKPIVHFGNKIYCPAITEHYGTRAVVVERLFTISTFDLVLMKWVEVKPCQL